MLLCVKSTLKNPQMDAPRYEKQRQNLKDNNLAIKGDTPEDNKLSSGVKYYLYLRVLPFSTSSRSCLTLRPSALELRSVSAVFINPTPHPPLALLAKEHP